MRRFLASAVLALAVTWPAHLLAGDPQGEPVTLENDRIEIKYVKPTSSRFMPIYESMKEKRVLEQLKQFLSPLILPVKLKITAKECGELNSWYSAGAGLTLCYDLIEDFKSIAPKKMTPEGYTRDDAITGMFLQVTFHELGHGMFDIYNIPVLGREEDAADQMAGFIMSQFGPDLARRTLPGAAYAWSEDFKKTWEGKKRWPYWDEHGHELQRAYNYLCMAYGSDPKTFAYYVDSGLLPKERAVNCKHEADQLLNAFQKTMLPHIDRDKMKAVQEKKWLPAVVGL